MNEFCDFSESIKTKLLEFPSLRSYYTEILPIEIKNLPIFKFEIF